MVVSWSIIVGLLTAILGSSVLASLLTHWLSKRHDKEEKQKVAAFLAITLARIFEKFAERSLNIIDAMETYSASSGSDGELATALARMDNLPHEMSGWEDLPPSLLVRVIDFEPNLQTIANHIGHAFNVVGHEEAITVVESQSIEQGIKALDIADALREEYGFTQRELKWDWMQNLRDASQKKVPFRTP